MSRVALFTSPLLLGFENFERTLDRISKHSTEGYPPYNVEQIGEDALRITLAVAGFAGGDLEIQVEGNQLVIRGRQSEEDGRTFLHRGIATRQFQRSFVLAEGLEVAGAALDNGLLTIELLRPAPVARVRRIEIRDAGSGARPDSAVQANAPAASLRGPRNRPSPTR